MFALFNILYHFSFCTGVAILHLYRYSAVIGPTALPVIN